MVLQVGQQANILLGLRRSYVEQSTCPCHLSQQNRIDDLLHTEFYLYADFLWNGNQMIITDAGTIDLNRKVWHTFEAKKPTMQTWSLRLA